MIVTEIQAKENWCPMVRHVMEAGPPGSFNRGQPSDPINNHPANDGSLCNCIGSACMMWRWYDHENKHYHDDPAKKKPRRGFCGMAGRPLNDP